MQEPIKLVHNLSVKHTKTYPNYIIMFENTTSLIIDTENSHYLYETARWGKFLSVVGFIFCGFLVLTGFFSKLLFSEAFQQAGAEVADIASVLATIIYIIIAVVYFFPCFYLYKFSKRMQMALRTNDSASLHESFSSLKSCFKFLGVFTIIILSVYGIPIILALIAAAALHS